MATEPQTQSNYNSPELNKYISEISMIAASLLNDLYKLIFSIDFSTLDMKELGKVEKKIDQLFLRKDKEFAKWVDRAMNAGYESGAIQAIIDLADAETREQAKKLIKLNSKTNKDILKILKQTTYNDLLKMTNNTKQRVKDMLSRVVMEVMKGREIGIAVSDFSKEIIRQLKEQAMKEMDFAIIDRAGREWTVKAYSEMVARTKIRQAHLQGVETEALMRDANYGLISSHGTTCKLCMPWEGKIVKLRPDAPGDFPLLSDVKSIPGKSSIFHPRCSHHVNVFRTLDTMPKTNTDQS